MDEIGKLIRYYRMRAGLTQEELAQKIGYKTKSSINKIEAGVNDFPRGKLQAFADALNVQPKDLVMQEYVEDKAAALTETEKLLLRYIQSMNDAGQERLLGYAEDIRDRYKKGEADAEEVQ